MSNYYSSNSDYDPDYYNSLSDHDTRPSGFKRAVRRGAGIIAAVAAAGAALFGLGKAFPGHTSSAVVASQCATTGQAKLCAEIGVQDGKLDSLAQFNSVNSRPVPMKIVSIRMSQNGRTLAQATGNRQAQAQQVNLNTSQAKCPPPNSALRLDVRGATYVDGRWQPVNVSTSTVSDGSCAVPTGHFVHPVIRANGAPGVPDEDESPFHVIDKGLRGLGRGIVEGGDAAGHGISHVAHGIGEEGGHGGFGGGEHGGFGGGHGGGGEEINLPVPSDSFGIGLR